MQFADQYLDQIWFGAAGAFLLGCATVIYILLRSPQSAPMWHRYLANLQTQLNLLASKTTPLEVVGSQLGVCAMLFAGWVVWDLWWAPILCLGVVPTTYAILSIARQQRNLQLALQLDGWLLMLANMLKATGSVGAAIRSTVELSPSPLSEELEILVSHVEIGRNLDDALESMYQRAPSNGLRSVATNLRVGRLRGGDLPSLLEKNAATLRESERIDALIRSKVSQGRAQMIVLAVSPPAFVLLLNATAPGFFDPLTGHAIAPIVYGTCGALWIGALIAGIKIMNIDA